MVVCKKKKEGPRKDPPCNLRAGRISNEPAVRKKIKVRIGSSRTMDFFRSVPLALPKVF